MKRWLGRHPWIWIVVFFLFVMGMNAAFVVIAVLHRPELVK
jgi:hypothetical protein